MFYKTSKALMDMSYLLPVRNSMNILTCGVRGTFAHYQLIIPMNIPARSVRSASGEVT